LTWAEMRRNGFGRQMEKEKFSAAAQIVPLILGRRARQRQNTLDSALCEAQRSQARQPQRRRNSLRIRETILRWGCAAILPAIVGLCAVAADLTKDDIASRKEVYVDKKSDKLPYRLFVPIWLQQREHLSAGVVAAVSRICTGATVPRGRELVRPGIQSANPRAACSAGNSCQRRKTVRD
jgi:hypothetical protein